MNTKLIDLSGAEKEEIELSDDIFNIKPNEGVIHDAVVCEQANKRQGTSSTKQRGEVSGSKKKPWRQKGTGRARAGSVKSPIWRGGGVTFGPQPRDFSYSLPKKIKRLSIRSILSKRNQEKRLRVIEPISTELGKTKDVLDKISAMSLINDEIKDLKNNKLRKKSRNYKLTIITDDGRETFKQGCRNIPWVKCLNYNRLSAYDLFYSHEIMIELSAVEKLQALYATKKK